MIPEYAAASAVAMAASPPSFSASFTFEVSVQRNTLGLGFSITCDASDNLVRIKKVFPMQPAWQTGRLRSGDVIVSADGIPLSGLPLRRALDVLRSGKRVTSLVVCRNGSNGNNGAASERRTSVTREDSLRVIGQILK
jgi:C-terminal processing protease CtpA/Prc